jgi:hypothetical protein
MSHTFHNPLLSHSNVAISALPYTVGTGITVADTWSTRAGLNPPTGKIILTGENADIEINGQSLNKTLQEIKDQLLIPTIINRDEKLESEFADLRQLGQEYQQKLEYYREQMKIFETLKK